MLLLLLLLLLLQAHSAPFSSFTLNSPVVAQLQATPNIQSRRRGAAVFPRRAHAGLFHHYRCNSRQSHFVLARALCQCGYCLCLLNGRR
jgi:hypothetical protein